MFKRQTVAASSNSRWGRRRSSAVRVSVFLSELLRLLYTKRRYCKDTFTVTWSLYVEDDIQIHTTFVSLTFRWP